MKVYKTKMIKRYVCENIAFFLLPFHHISSDIFQGAEQALTTVVFYFT